MSRVEICPCDVKADITDVADWFLLKQNMSNKKIQKLCYYAQAWCLALLDCPIANNATFEAWVHGPVNRKLYSMFRDYGWRELKLVDVEGAREKVSKVFNDEQKDVLESVWETYGEYSADELETLTHQEEPWLEQREGLSKFDNCNKIISEQTMKKYYRSIAI